MVDKKTIDEKSATKSADQSSDNSSAQKSATKKPGATNTKKQAANNKAADNKAAEKNTPKATPKAATAATAKAGALKESAMKSAASKINAVDKKSVASAGKTSKSTDELKMRAREAKQRAQKKILEKAYVSDKPTDPLERLANTFDSSARRWEMVVYPSLFAFVLLAGYGFFLIYRLTHDIAILSQSVTHMAVIVSDSMPRMTKDLGSMTSSIDNMTGNIDGMTGEISSMSKQMDALTPMSNNIQSMTHNIGSMNRSVYGMQRDMHGMNRTVSSGPFGMMNDMMPFSSNSNVPPPISQPPTWPSYSNQNMRNLPPRSYQSARTVPTKQVNTTAQKKMKPKVIMPGASPVSLKPVK